MYLRAVHADATVQQLRQLIRDNPLGILTTAIPSESHPLLQSSHIPFILDLDETDDSKLSTLRGHIARQNPQSKAIIESLGAPTQTRVLDQEVLVLFTSTIQHYVTPKFYTQTKPDSGKVVPTWNYAAAQVYGKARIYHKSAAEETVEFLVKQIDDLSRYAEEDLMGHEKAWKVADAPERYIELLRKNIIGIEIEIDRMEGKFKMSQEMSGDRNGIVDGFESLETGIGQKMASLVKERGDFKDAATSRR